MASTSNTQTQQAQPGAAFRLPGIGAPPRMIPESGPCAPNASTTLSQGAQTPVNFSNFEQLDIVRGYVLQQAFNTTFTAGTSETLTQSPLFPYNLTSNLTVQLQAAYATMNLPGWLAQVMQGYRSFLAPRSFTTDVQEGANVVPAKTAGSTTYNATVSPQTGNLAANTAGTAQSYNVFYEIPVAQYFDLYWEIDPTTGQPLAPYPRAIVSPARMAATQRNVTPSVTMNALLGNEQYDFPVSKASADTTSTATGTVQNSWWRDGWVPTDNVVTEPPGYGWQYARLAINMQPAQALAPIVNLQNDRAGQGQILSVVFGVWDPALNSGVGGFTPNSAYQSLQLRIGSTVQLYNDSPNTNVLRWSLRHGRALPFGMFGWDLALTEDGRLTNENVINTLIQGGAQIVPTFNSGSQPGASATLWVGVESLQPVTV